jgi:hypothetical protein
MIVAKIYPDQGNGGRGKKNALFSNGVNQRELSKASLVLKVPMGPKSTHNRPSLLSAFRTRNYPGSGADCCGSTKISINVAVATSLGPS